MDLQGLRAFNRYTNSNSQKVLDMLMENGFDDIYAVPGSKGFMGGGFEDMRFEPGMVTHERETRTLEYLSKKYNFPLPTENFFTFHFGLGQNDFLGPFSDACYLYLPDFSYCIRKTINQETYNGLIDVVKGFTSITGMDLIMIYDTERFALPKLLRAKKKCGEVRTYQTPKLDGEEYFEDWQKRDENNFSWSLENEKEDEKRMIQNLMNRSE
jgi:hypothetical protein